MNNMTLLGEIVRAELIRRGFQYDYIFHELERVLGDWKFGVFIRPTDLGMAAVKTFDSIQDRDLLDDICKLDAIFNRRCKMNKLNR